MCIFKSLRRKPNSSTVIEKSDNSWNSNRSWTYLFHRWYVTGKRIWTRRPFMMKKMKSALFSLSFVNLMILSGTILDRSSFSFWTKYIMPMINFVINLGFKKLRQWERLTWLVEVWSQQRRRLSRGCLIDIIQFVPLILEWKCILLWNQCISKVERI